MDYKDSLHLPKTDFPMKASLPQQEPARLEFWKQNRIYEKLVQKNAGAKKYILHDGPPYANGSIHFGHILNKVLKDIIVKQRNMAGLESPYVPGWDCHGLPIELGALKALGEKEKDPARLADPIVKRSACRDYAYHFINEQREQFKKLGIFADWDNPYLTLTNDYEASIAREFMNLYLKGYVYIAHKPVHWCTSCKTALAEAEVEYENIDSPSIYVRFKIDGTLIGQELPTSLVIWTTTPWTLPANVALAVNADFDYAAVKIDDEILIVESSLKAAFLEKCGLPADAPTVRSYTGAEFCELGIKAEHPFIRRESPVLAGHHVTNETGTGIVHIAPGHGQDDYIIGQKFKLPTICPVAANGTYFDDKITFTDLSVRFTEIKNWLGLFVGKANPVITTFLKDKGILINQADAKMRHPYPHCWRCKNPIIFRATEQWFCSLAHNDLRTRTLKTIDENVRWIPDWGRDRIRGMIAGRPDWCLSRQRIWGVPITIHRTEDGEILMNEEIRDHIVAAFEKEGADAWWKSPEPLLPESFLKKYAGKKITKEASILDVWFDSGVSFAAVLEKRSELQFPADLYLEGSDQHRGWFHSSLLASLATREKAPYKAVLTHGFVVDGQGKKYSKSAKNYTPPEKILTQMGAELLRLWVAAEDYRNDIRVSDEIMKVLAEVYRKIRNTFRFILGCLDGFDADTQKIPYDKRHELDQYALHSVQELVGRVSKAYEDYEFHTVHHSLNRFFTVDLSAFYLDILKDRLYCDATSDVRRLSAQSTLHDIVMTTLPLLAPILSFTAEEIWSYFPGGKKIAESVFLLPWPHAEVSWKRTDLADRYSLIMKLREDVLKQLELARQAKEIGHGLDARVTLFSSDENFSLLNQYKDEWTQVFIVSQVVISETPIASAKPGINIPSLQIAITRATGEKCARCWNYSEEVGKSSAHPTICKRCEKAVA